MEQQRPSKRNVVSTAQENDVLLGRGNQINNRRGNLQYRAFVKERATEYWFCPDKFRKDAIAREVIHKIKQAGGRFLKPVSAENPHGEWKQIFEIVDEGSVLGKTKQALRDTAAAKRLDGTCEQVARGSAAAAQAEAEQQQQHAADSNRHHAASAGGPLSSASFAGFPSASIDGTPPLLSLMGGGAAAMGGGAALERLRALQSLGPAAAFMSQHNPFSPNVHRDPAYLLPARVELERDRLRWAQMQQHAMMNEKLLQMAAAGGRFPNATTTPATANSNNTADQRHPQWLQLQLLQQQQAQQQQQMLLQGLLGNAAAGTTNTLDPSSLLQQREGATNNPGIDPALLAFLQQQQRTTVPIPAHSLPTETASKTTLEPIKPDDEKDEEEDDEKDTTANEVVHQEDKSDDDDDDDDETSSEDEEELVGLANKRSAAC